MRPLFFQGGTAALIVAASLFTSGCGSMYQKYNEQMVTAQIHGNDKAPDWVKGQIQSDGRSLSFVGRGTGYNVLDERKAFDEAFMHAREQLAQYVGTRVISESCDQDWAFGARFLPIKDAGPGNGEHPDQALRSRAKQVAEAIVGELLPMATYWEQWDVQENPRRHWDGLWLENDHRFDMRRYKCWVLASIPRDRVDKFVTATLEMLKNEAEVEKLKAEVANLKQGHGSHAQAQIDAQVTTLINAKEREIQHLRERIHYGRAFRLTTKDNCPVADPCVPAARPEWRRTAVDLNATVGVVVQTVPAPSKPCDICEDAPKGGY
jgi:hypothetical protein